MSAIQEWSSVFEINKNAYLRSLVSEINRLGGELENNVGEPCCGMACNCYDNLIYDISLAQENLHRNGYHYEYGDNTFGIWVGDIPASVDDANEGYYPDEF